MGVTQKSGQRDTYIEYLTWPEDERWELIDGVACAMTAAPGRLHQALSVELTRQIANFLRDGSRTLYTAPFDVRLPTADEADEQVATVVQPDLAVICDPRQLDDEGCRGAPDWVVEILSPSTASRDQIDKVRLYARHGVKEYWTVHPTDRLVMIWRLDESGHQYQAPEILEGKGTVAVATVPGLEVDLDLVFAATWWDGLRAADRRPGWRPWDRPTATRRRPLSR